MYGVPYGSRTRGAAVKEKQPNVIQRNLAALIALYRLKGLTGTLIGLLMGRARRVSDRPPHHGRPSGAVISYGLSFCRGSSGSNFRNGR